MSEENPVTLRARCLQLFTQDEAIVLMRRDSAVCRSEGLSARSRVELRAGGRVTIATLYQTDDDWLECDEAGLSLATARLLGVSDGDGMSARHAPTVHSRGDVRRRIYGNRLDAAAFKAIIGDIVGGRYADIDVTSFIVGCAAVPLDTAEMTALTGAMVAAGDRLRWDAPVVIDKHCVGGLPGNRTTPIIVPILAALGLTMPKTSSRAITSPAGTADTMATLAPVNFDLPTLQRVVKTQGACLAWGGSMRLSPADDLLIRVERAIDIDTEGQMVASILSKKIAAGSTHVVIDIPVGPTAKIKTTEAARSLALHLVTVAANFGLTLRCIESDGSQPVGRGIGPALEANDVLAVLRCEPGAPPDLRERSLVLAGAALELAGAVDAGEGTAIATTVLDDGRAWAKFKAICAAQGGMRVPPTAALKHTLLAEKAGTIAQFDNRRISRLARLAGAPDDPAAGLELHVRLGDCIPVGAPLLTIHAESPGELQYALDYAASHKASSGGMIGIRG